MTREYGFSSLHRKGGRLNSGMGGGEKKFTIKAGKAQCKEFSDPTKKC
jgi:hypothetical protein